MAVNWPACSARARGHQGSVAGVGTVAGIFSTVATGSCVSPSLSLSSNRSPWRPARGYVVVLTNGQEIARDAPRDLAAALEIFAAAATYWLVKDKLFMVLVDAGTRGGHALKTLPA